MKCVFYWTKWHIDYILETSWVDYVLREQKEFLKKCQILEKTLTIFWIVYINMQFFQIIFQQQV